MSAVTADTTVIKPSEQLSICKPKKEQPEEIVLPQYYRETYFAKDSLLHPEISVGHSGVAGEPVPQTVHSDDTINIILLIYFILAVVISSNSRQAISHRLKIFFYPLRKENDYRNNPIRHFQFFMSILTCLLYAILYYFYTNQFNKLSIEEPYLLIAIFLAVFIGYFLVKIQIYDIVNATFFNHQKRIQWIDIFTFITAMEGILLFPAVILQVYVNLPMQITVYYFIFIHLLAKILTFYKCWSIFFKENRDFLQIILYLCALEIVPMFTLGGVLVLIVNELKVTI